LRIAPINLGRIRRHRLGVGPPPAYRVSRTFHKEDLPSGVQKWQRAWGEAVPHDGPATITAVEQGDYVTLTIAFDA